MFPLKPSSHHQAYSSPSSSSSSTKVPASTSASRLLSADTPDVIHSTLYQQNRLSTISSDSFHNSPSQSSFLSNETGTTLSIDSRLVQLSTDTSSNSLLQDNNNKLLSPLSESSDNTSGSPSLSMKSLGKFDSKEQPADLLKKTWSNRVSKYSLLGPGQILPTEQITSGLMVQGPYCITGEVSLALVKNVPEQSLVVTVLSCNNITEKVIITGVLQDWYIKIYMRIGDNRNKIKKRKTGFQRSATDPTFQEMFKYSTDFKEAFLEVSLWINRGMFGHNKVVGMAIVSLDQIKFEENQDNPSVQGDYKLLAASRRIDAK